MRLPACLLPCLVSLVAVLLAPPAQGRPVTGAHDEPQGAWAREAPAPLSLLPVEPETMRAVRIPPHLMTDAPVTAGAWVVHGTLALVPFAGVYGASRLGGERLWVTAVEMAAGSALGAAPARLLFLHSADSGGRWEELDVAAFGVGLTLTPPLAALGTWGLGELAFHGSQDRGGAFLGALGGAAVGTLLGVAVHGLLEEVVGNRDTLKPLRELIAVGFIGSGATVGYQWAGGGPRARSR